MTRKRAKRNCGRKVDNETNSMAEDRISKLPDDLIHYIFSFLPTIYIVQMGCLSKRWRRMWVSTPYLYFEDEFKNITFTRKVNKRNMFLKLVANCLRFRKLYTEQPNMPITSFKLYTHFKFGRYADNWVRYAMESKVKELNLIVKDYCLPQFVLNANSLTKLNLRGLDLEVPFISSFPTLKVLSLMFANSDHKSLQNFFSGCPVIEDLHLYYLSREESFIPEVFPGKLNIDLAAGGTLKSLSLLHVKFTDQWLEGQISGLPLLESLTIQFCELENISIDSRSLQSLSLHESPGIKVSIRTPSLSFLSLVCYPISIISIEAPNLIEANLGIFDKYSSEPSYDDLIHFLSLFSGLKKMGLYIGWTQDMLFTEKIRSTFSPPLPNLKHLRVMYHSQKNPTDLEDFLDWCAPSLESLKTQIGRNSKSNDL